MDDSRYKLSIGWDPEDAIFVVDVPELPGCSAHGETKKSALTNAEQAIRLWLETAKADGIPVPEPKGRRLEA